MCDSTVFRKINMKHDKKYEEAIMDMVIKIEINK